MLGLNLADVALAAPVGFAVGLVCGFLASNRWALTRRPQVELQPAPPAPVRDYGHDRGEPPWAASGTSTSAS